MSGGTSRRWPVGRWAGRCVKVEFDLFEHLCFLQYSICRTYVPVKKRSIEKFHIGCAQGDRQPGIMHPTKPNQGGGGRSAVTSWQPLVRTTLMVEECALTPTHNFVSSHRGKGTVIIQLPTNGVVY